MRRAETHPVPPQVNAAIGKFSIRLLKKLADRAEREENIVFSGQTLFTALSMTFLGAKGLCARVSVRPTP